VSALAVVAPPALVTVCREQMRPEGPPTGVYGLSIADLVPAEPGAWIVQVNGEWIPREHWHYQPPPGAVVRIVALAAGGGKGGSNPLRMILTLAVMYFTAGMGGALLGINGAAAVGAAGVNIANALVTGLAVALVNNLIPIDRSNAPVDRGSVFGAQAQANIARLGQPIPEEFGFRDNFPDLASQAYNLYASNESYLHACLVLTVGQEEIQRVSIGDTPIEAFSEAEVVRFGPGQSTQSGPGSGVETLAEQTLVNTRMVINPDAQQIELKTGDPAGPYSVCPPERTVTQIGIDVVMPRGLDSGKSISWRAELQAVNDFDQPTGAWSTLASETYSTANTLPIRLSYDYTVAEGRYLVRVTRTDIRSSSSGSNHDINLLALRGVLGGPAMNTTGLTGVCVKVRASGQLSGGLRFKVRRQRMLPVWDGSTWSAPQATRNPAWAFARVLKARNTPDSRIDLDQLLALAAVWDARQDRFDHDFKEPLTTWDALTMICRVGRAVPLIRAGKYTLVRDQAETEPQAFFGMRNIRRGTWRLEQTLPADDPIEALDVEYMDLRRTGPVTVTAQIHGSTIYAYRGDLNRPVGVPEPDAERRARIRIPGIVGEQAATRFAVYTLADGAFRTTAAAFSAELDGTLPAPLGLVTLQHDIGDFGQGGDVADWDAGTLTLETTEPLAWEPTASHFMRLMRPDGTVTGRIACHEGADAHHAVLADAPDFTPLFDDAGRERTRYVFGTAETIDALGKVMSIKVSGDDVVQLRCRLEDDRVHTADNAWLPAGEQDPLPPLVPVDPDAGGVPLVNLSGWSLLNTAGVTAYHAAVTMYNDGRLSVTASGEFGTEFFRPNDWAVPQPVTTGVSSLYEVYATATTYSGSGTWSGSALGTWLGLDTTRAWSVEPIGTDGHTFGLHLQIRDVATGVVQAAGTYYLEYPVESGGGA
jgi:hypothetical protein